MPIIRIPVHAALMTLSPHNCTAVVEKSKIILKTQVGQKILGTGLSFLFQLGIILMLNRAYKDIITFVFLVTQQMVDG